MFQCYLWFLKGRLDSVRICTPPEYPIPQIVTRRVREFMFDASVMLLAEGGPLENSVLNKLYFKALPKIGGEVLLLLEFCIRSFQSPSVLQRVAACSQVFVLTVLNLLYKSQGIINSVHSGSELARIRTNASRNEM